MNIKTFRYLLDGFIQEDYEYYNKPYVISPNYLGFIQEFLDIPPEYIKNIQDLFGLEMIKIYKFFDKSNNGNFTFRGYFKYNYENYTFIGNFDNDFEVYSICKVMNFNYLKSYESVSPYDLTLEIQSLSEKYSIPNESFDFLKIINKL